MGRENQKLKTILGDYPNAYLGGTNFSDAKGLTREQIIKSRNWEHTKFDRDFFEQLSLP